MFNNNNNDNNNNNNTNNNNGNNNNIYFLFFSSKCFSLKLFFFIMAVCFSASTNQATRRSEDHNLFSTEFDMRCGRRPISFCLLDEKRTARYYTRSSVLFQQHADHKQRGP